MSTTYIHVYAISYYCDSYNNQNIMQLIFIAIATTFVIITVLKLIL